MNNSKTVQYVMGLTIPDGIICFDNTRGIDNTEGYTAITRTPSPEKFMFLHEIKNLKELRLLFRPNQVALALDLYIMNECKRLGTCVINVDFIYDKVNNQFRKNTEVTKKNDQNIKKFLMNKLNR
jgi:hypothetical protein